MGLSNYDIDPGWSSRCDPLKILQVAHGVLRGKWKTDISSPTSGEACRRCRMFSHSIFRVFDATNCHFWASCLHPFSCEDCRNLLRPPKDSRVSLTGRSLGSTVVWLRTMVHGYHGAHRSIKNNLSPRGRGGWSDRCRWQAHSLLCWRSAKKSVESLTGMVGTGIV